MRTHARLVVVVGLIALALTAPGCSFSRDTAAAEAEVPKFHGLLNAQRFAEIYNGATEELKSKASETQFVELLDAVHRKLGNVRVAQRGGWNVNYSTSGSFVTLQYKTSYEHGEADEQFVYRIQNKEARLAGDHINSNALITR